MYTLYSPVPAPVLQCKAGSCENYIVSVGQKSNMQVMLEK